MNGQEVTNRSSMSVSLTLNTLPQLREFCGVLAKTGMVPKAYQDKPDDILVAMLHGQEVGLPHLQALQSIAVVNGIPSIYGDAALAMVRASGKLEEFDEYIEVDGVRQERDFPIMKYADEDKEVVAICRSKRAGMAKERVTTYSVRDAQRAGLWKKAGPWQTVPQRMIMWRARGWNLRDNFGDVLKGLAIYEEAMDIEVSRGNDGAYRMPIAIPDGQSDAEMKQIQDMMNQKPSDTPTAQEEVWQTKQSTIEDPAPRSTATKANEQTISEEDWNEAIRQIEEDPNLRVLKDLVKVNMKLKGLKLVEKGKQEFIRQFRVECEKEGLGAAVSRIFG